MELAKRDEYVCVSLEVIAIDVQTGMNEESV